MPEGRDNKVPGSSGRPHGGRERGEAEGCHAPGCRPPPRHSWSPGRHGLSQTHSEVARGKCHQRGRDLIQWDPSPYKRKRHQSSLPSARTQREGPPDCRWEGAAPRPWHGRSPAAGFQPPEPGGAGSWHSLGRPSRRRLGPEGGLCGGAPSSKGPVPDTITGRPLLVCGHHSVWGHYIPVPGLAEVTVGPNWSAASSPIPALP